jgi:putative oxidoreductase
MATMTGTLTDTRTTAREIATGANVASFAFMAPLGRFFFAFIFLLSSYNHLSGNLIQYAAQAGVPAPGFFVPASGILALIGALSIILGYYTRAGALLIILFLVPITLMMHNFWTLDDPMMRQMQMSHFLKNLSMLGGACLLFYFGAGPMSIDARKSINA